jgi:hypothetical protein
MDLVRVEHAAELIMSMIDDREDAERLAASGKLWRRIFNRLCMLRRGGDGGRIDCSGEPIVGPLSIPWTDVEALYDRIARDARIMDLVLHDPGVLTNDHAYVDGDRYVGIKRCANALARLLQTAEVSARLRSLVIAAGTRNDGLSWGLSASHASIWTSLSQSLIALTSLELDSASDITDDLCESLLGTGASWKLVTVKLHGLPVNAFFGEAHRRLCKARRRRRGSDAADTSAEFPALESLETLELNGCICVASETGFSTPATFFPRLKKFVPGFCIDTDASPRRADLADSGERIRISPDAFSRFSTALEDVALFGECKDAGHQAELGTALAALKSLRSLDIGFGAPGSAPGNAKRPQFPQIVSKWTEAMPSVRRLVGLRRNAEDYEAVAKIFPNLVEMRERVDLAESADSCYSAEPANPGAPLEQVGDPPIPALPTHARASPARPLMSRAPADGSVDDDDDDAISKWTLKKDRRAESAMRDKVLKETAASAARSAGRAVAAMTCIWLPKLSVVGLDRKNLAPGMTSSLANSAKVAERSATLAVIRSTVVDRVAELTCSAELAAVSTAAAASWPAVAAVVSGIERTFARAKRGGGGGGSGGALLTLCFDDALLAESPKQALHEIDISMPNLRSIEATISHERTAYASIQRICDCAVAELLHGRGPRLFTVAIRVTAPELGHILTDESPRLEEGARDALASLSKARTSDGRRAFAKLTIEADARGMVFAGAEPEELEVAFSVRTEINGASSHDWKFTGRVPKSIGSISPVRRVLASVAPSQYDSSVTCAVACALHFKRTNPLLSARVSLRSGATVFDVRSPK